MRLILFYDLPFYNEQMVKKYTRFRTELLRNGFHMMQFSIYSRIFRNEEAAKQMLKKIKTFVPNEGNIRAMLITEKQYQRMEILVGKKTLSEQILDERKLIEI